MAMRATRFAACVWLVLSLVTAAALTATVARAAVWRSTGPFGGIVNIVVVDPRAPATIYAASPFGGVFKSIDRGGHWTRASTGLTDPTVFTLAINPLNSQILYAAGGNGIFKTVDGAAHWRKVNALVNVRELAIDPHTPSRIFAVVNQGPVYKSTDSGSTWTSQFSVLPSQAVYAFAIDPQNANNLYAGAQGGLYKSTNGGTSYTLVTAGLGTGFVIVQALYVNPLNPKIIYATTGQGLEKSTNGGVSWSVLSGAPAAMMAIDPKAPNVLYGIANLGDIRRSSNSGAAWTGIGSVAAGFGGDVRTITVDPTLSTRLYAGTDHGVFTSANRGGTWTEVNTGLANTIVTALATDAKAPGTLYAGTEYSGVFKSTNAGTSWTRINADWVDKVSGLLVDPVTTSRVYFGSAFGKGIFKSGNGGSTWSNVLPFTVILAMGLDPAAPTTLYAAGGANIVSKSTNAGSTWVARNVGLPTAGMQPNAVSAFGKTVLLTDPNNGAFISTSGGNSWAANNPTVNMLQSQGMGPAPVQGGFKNIAEGIIVGSTVAEIEVRLGVVSPAPGNRLGFARGLISSGSASLPAATPWTAWAAPSGVAAADCPPITALASDPSTPSTFYAGGLCGVLKGTNNGAKLAALGTGLPPNTQVQALAISSNGKTLFAGMAGGGVYKLALP